MWFSEHSVWKDSRVHREVLEKVVTIRGDAALRQGMEKLGAKSELRVRFVGVRLPSRELQAWVASLCHEQRYPPKRFGELFHERFGIETSYILLKSHLDLENSMGETNLLPGRIRQPHQLSRPSALDLHPWAASTRSPISNRNSESSTLSEYGKLMPVISRLIQRCNAPFEWQIGAAR